MKNLVNAPLAFNVMLSFLMFGFLMVYGNAWAADAVNASPSTGIFKMMCGLAIVLAVMAIIAWAIKRVLPNIGNNQQSVARVISSVSVGSRERVVVVQVADRWIVVGVAPGQVNGIANLDAASQQVLENTSDNHANTNLGGITQAFSPTFSQWLQKSTAKFINHKSGLEEK